MTWQDVILGAGAISFVAALVPLVFQPYKPPLHLSGPVGGWLVVYAITYATLGLAFAAVATAAQGFVWLVVFAQTLRQRRKSRKTST